MKTNYPRPTCLITGCLLIKEEEQIALWGDLHALGNCLIFNSVGFWEDASKFDYADKLIYVNGTTERFEKKSLWIMPIEGTKMNSIAVAHIGDN